MNGKLRKVSLVNTLERFLILSSIVEGAGGSGRVGSVHSSDFDQFICRIEILFWGDWMGGGFEHLLHERSHLYQIVLGVFSANYQDVSCRHSHNRAALYLSLIHI